MTLSIVPASFLEGMRNVTGHVAIVTAFIPGEGRIGMTATAFSSLSNDPPAILTCINKSSQLGSNIGAVRHFCINVLARDHNGLSDIFAGRGGHAGEARFAFGDWDALPSGVPMLREALAVFEAELESTIPYTSHYILIGRVLQTWTTRHEGTFPLLYSGGAYRTLAHFE